LIVYTNIENLTDLEKDIINNITQFIDGKFRRSVVQRSVSQPNKIKVLYTYNKKDYIRDITDDVSLGVIKFKRNEKLTEILK